MQRYFIKEKLAQSQTINLSRDISHHLKNVLREENGSNILLVDEDQQLFLAEIIQVGRFVQVEIIEQLVQQVELPIDVHIICGLSKKDKPEWIVQKATELGATSISFIQMDRSIVKWNNKKSKQKIERFQRIAQEAAEQSHRLLVPTIDFIDSWVRLADQLKDEVVILADEEQAKNENNPSFIGFSSSWDEIIQNGMNHHSIYAIFGPEGGISTRERVFFEQWTTIKSLGPRILRTETAPLYFLSIISAYTELNFFNRRGE